MTVPARLMPAWALSLAVLSLHSDARVEPPAQTAKLEEPSEDPRAILSASHHALESLSGSMTNMEAQEGVPTTDIVPVPEMKGKPMVGKLAEIFSASEYSAECQSAMVAEAKKIKEHFIKEERAKFENSQAAMLEKIKLKEQDRAAKMAELEMQIAAAQKNIKDVELQNAEKLKQMQAGHEKEMAKKQEDMDKEVEAQKEDIRLLKIGHEKMYEDAKSEHEGKLAQKEAAQKKIEEQEQFNQKQAENGLENDKKVVTQELEDIKMMMMLLGKEKEQMQTKFETEQKDIKDGFTPFKEQRDKVLAELNDIKANCETQLGQQKAELKKLSVLSGQYQMENAANNINPVVDKVIEIVAGKVPDDTIQKIEGIRNSPSEAAEKDKEIEELKGKMADMTEQLANAHQDLDGAKKSIAAHEVEKAKTKQGPKPGTIIGPNGQVLKLPEPWNPAERAPPAPTLKNRMASPFFQHKIAAGPDAPVRDDQWYWYRGRHLPQPEDTNKKEIMVRENVQGMGAAVGGLERAEQSTTHRQEHSSKLLNTKAQLQNHKAAHHVKLSVEEQRKLESLRRQVLGA